MLFKDLMWNKIILASTDRYLHYNSKEKINFIFVTSIDQRIHHKSFSIPQIFSPQIPFPFLPSTQTSTRPKIQISISP